LELWDVLDGDGRRKGRVMVRGDEIQPGDYHLVVHVWIKNDRGEYLIQKRADTVEQWPGVWATTGGSVIAGEDSLSGAVREVKEELGLALDSSTLRRLMRHARRTALVDVWLAEVATEDTSGSYPGPEVSEIMWASKRQIKDMIDSGDFFPYDYLEILPD
jgi:8-oxo-dGTP diphosphatase